MWNKKGEKGRSINEIIVQLECLLIKCHQVVPVSAVRVEEHLYVMDHLVHLKKHGR